MDTGIVILAAGSSTRLGQPKQLLPYKGTSLLKHAVKQSLAVSNAVAVVTGAFSQAIENELEEFNNFKVTVVNNTDWESGMGTSVKTGVNNLLLHHPNIKHCIIMVCDQPYVNTQVLNQLQETQAKSGKNIVASHYAGILGVPALFTRNYFDDLLQLDGPEGARKIFKLYADDVAAVPFEEGATDIDTIEDYNRLLQSDDFSTGR